MNELNIKTDDIVIEKLKSYPSHIIPKVNHLRHLIVQRATELDAVDEIEETLKWGEPSYIAKKGSTIRIDWKAKAPDQYAMYFKCTSKLVETFRSVYGDTFRYEKNRAILFDLDDVIPERELKQCIGAALQYHNVKHEDNLGIDIG